MAKPEVSVVMSVYNDARYLCRAMDSVLSQEDVDFEFVIVNDGSTDNSVELLEEYAQKDSRIKIVHQENSGLTKALIKGCKVAQGELIARQDADDFSMPGRFATQLRLLKENDEVVFVSSWAEVIGPEDEPLLLHKRPADFDEATRQLLEDRIGPPGHGSVMFRRDVYLALGGYRPQCYYAQDSDLWLRFGAIGKLAYIQQVLYQYRISDASISGGMHEAKLPFANLVDELYEARCSGQSEELILGRAPTVDKSSNGSSSKDKTLYFIGRCLLARRDQRSFKYLYRSVCANPFNIRAWLYLLVSCPLLLKRVDRE